MAWRTPSLTHKRNLPKNPKSFEEETDSVMEETDGLPVGAAGTSLGSAARSSLVLLLQSPHGGAHATLSAAPPPPVGYIQVASRKGGGKGRLEAPHTAKVCWPHNLYPPCPSNECSEMQRRSSCWTFANLWPDSNDLWPSASERRPPGSPAQTRHAWKALLPHVGRNISLPRGWKKTSSVRCRAFRENFHRPGFDCFDSERQAQE